jgi:hypothetical protein
MKPSLLTILINNIWTVEANLGYTSIMYVDNMYKDDLVKMLDAVEEILLQLQFDGYDNK